MNIRNRNNFSKNPRTNWRYILIVIILTFFVGGGILGYCYWWLPKQEIQITKIPEIKKPEKPEKIEEIIKLPTIAGLVNDSRLRSAEEVYVSGKYAYMTGGETLTIVDISNPTNPIVVSSISDPKLVGNNGLSIFDKYAYVVVAGAPVVRTGPKLIIIDISKPLSPAIVGSITDLRLGGCEGVYVLNDYAYVVAKDSKNLTIIDVSNPEIPKIVSSVSVSDPKELTWPYKIFVLEKYAYITSWGIGADTLIIVDISNPENPVVTGRVKGPKDATDVYVSGTYAYITAVGGVLAIFDISDFTAPLMVGSIKDEQLEPASGVHVSGKYAYVAGGVNLTAVDISNPEVPVIVASLSDWKLEGADDPFVLGRYVYVPTDYAQNLVIVDLKGEIVFTPKPVPILSKEILKLEEKFVAKNEREIAFLQDGDIWVVSEDLKRKYEIIDTKEAITNFSFSPRGKEIYWLNEKGEIWKKDEEGEIRPLITVEKDMKEKTQEWGEWEPVSYYEGKVENFWLSPDGNYIAYEALEGYTGCCAGPPEISVGRIRIMRSDGTEKVIVERPSGIWRPLIFFDGWLPDSKKILFHFQAADEPTSGSPFFEVGVDGENPKIYTEIFKFFKEGVEVKGEDISPEDLELFTIMVVGAEPIYSPTGEKVAYIKELSQIRLRDIKTKETKTILESEGFPFGLASRILIWSEDGSLLLVKGVDKIFVFDKEGKIVFETDLDAEAIERAILSPDNKYLGGVYTMKKERIEIIFFINLIIKEKKEFKLPEFKDYLGTINIYPQFFSESNRLYYLIEIKDEYPIHQLWVIDTDTWKNYKVIDDILQVVRAP